VIENEEEVVIGVERSGRGRLIDKWVVVVVVVGVDGERERDLVRARVLLHLLSTSAPPI